MPKLPAKARRLIEEALDMQSGYVLDFSDRTFADFFEEFGIDIGDDKYKVNGTSKAKRMRAFIEIEDAAIVAPILRALWSRRQESDFYRQKDEASKLAERYLPELAVLEGGAVPTTAGIDRFAKDETLEELVSAIERDIAAVKPVSALDRLHTYCMKRFGHLLDKHGVDWKREEPLHSRVGKYVKVVGPRRGLHEMTYQIVRNGIGIFEKFNDVRNNESLVHDNEIIEQSEARFIFDSVTAFLRFVKRIEGE